MKNQTSLGTKETQKISRNELEKLLAISRGDETPDILIKNVNILDMVTGSCDKSAIVISDKWIAGTGLEYENVSAKRVIDAKGMTVVPGFIDSHLHIESSLMNPFEFEAVTLPLGTTTIICDPHEITNVLGKVGFDWFLRSSVLTHQNMFVQASSCVPALDGVETNGASFKLNELKKVIDHEHVLGLAEMMDFPSVIYGNPNVLDKLESFESLNLDGHGPLLEGTSLNAYIAAGIQNDHETVSAHEANEKLKRGMSVIIREGSVAKNLDALAPIINEFSSINCLLCTDDRNPYEIFHEGHINYLIKQLINKHNVKPHLAYRVASYSAARHFGLKRLGLIAPGKQADIVFLKDVNSVDIDSVMVKGSIVSELDLSKNIESKIKKSIPPLQNTIKRKKVSPSDFSLSLSKGTYRVIEIIPNEIITKPLEVKFDNVFEQTDIIKISVVERYGHNSPPAIGLVKGFEIKNGAIASSVAHDSHNIIVIGDNDEDIAIAVNKLIESGGGFVVVNNHQITSCLELPVAGLMSVENSKPISKNLESSKIATKSLGCPLAEPFLQMAFLALPVIPSLKITDKGLFDVTSMSYVDLKI